MMAMISSRHEGERVQDYLHRPDPIAQLTYALYQWPASGPMHRRVVVVTGRHRGPTPPGYEWVRSDPIGADVVSELIWNVLWDGEQRIGEVVYDCEPNEDDYIVECTGDGYRIALLSPVLRQASVA
jgi:hypothetical protein